MKKNVIEKIEKALREAHRLASQYTAPMPDDKWYNAVMTRVRAVHDAKADALQRFIWPFAAASAACALTAALYAVFSGSGSGYSVFGVFIDDPSGISALQLFL
ncbi:hypothetical protein [Candidatus Magnetominusculus xianensis]|uniref:Uncharacterized protein n=1 Tax=Candidatus Magnetominusculus xianensis TaxID=1748249 RepID=A0ABR5SHC3_9BACT|nr:hypothetical protein [Candidatus Magnetominusculus xianensis]KWT91084.1 hypothetical protein ASN18_0908 [Candidatus Magnetominusculus xianensis]MBF0403271.1 hypothetical protein [Nitrospirota bacterium]